MAETITWGLHASAVPADTVEASLLLAGADEEFNGVLRVVNQHTAETTYGVAHCTAEGVATADEWVAFTTTKINHAGPPHEYSIHLGKSQELRIKSGYASKVSFHFSGEKKVTS